LAKNQKGIEGGMMGQYTFFGDSVISIVAVVVVAILLWILVKVNENY